ncbi:MAG: DUF58 domain-containing protein [Candidatus Thorarchaeota archaeon]
MVFKLKSNFRITTSKKNGQGWTEQKPRVQLLNYLFLALFLLIFSIILQTWFFAGVILPILLIFFFSLTSEEIDVHHLIIERQVSRNKTEVKGELIHVHLKLINEGSRIPILEVVDLIPNECTVNEGSNHWMSELNEGESITFSYAIQGHRRGRYKIGPILIRGTDLFGFHSVETKYNNLSSFDVVPSLIKLKYLQMSRQRLLPETGYIPSLIYKGRDFDFQGVRDHQETDELRTINWRVSAKFNKLATNEFALDQSTRVFVLFDHTDSTIRVLEEGVISALSISEYLISQRNKVAFFGIGEFIHEIPAAPGKRQLLKINEFLIDVKCSQPLFKDTLYPRLTKRLLPSLTSFSQIFFITPLYNRIIVNFLHELVKKGFNVTLVIPRLERDSEGESDHSDASLIANALLSLDRGYMQDKVSKLGMKQIHWFPYGPKYESMKMRLTK